MGKNKLIMSFIILFGVFGVIFLDIAGAFGYTDVSFVIGFFLFGLFILLQKSTSKMTFGMTLFLLLFLGTSYIPTGAGKVTERIGEWFYLFFAFGLVHYIKETWSSMKEYSEKPLTLSLYGTIRYYALFLYYKFRIFFDCTNGRTGLYIAELLHIFNSLVRKTYEMPYHEEIRKITTIFGTFLFRADNYEYSILSPAFERPDMELFIHEMQKSVDAGKRVLFLDVGANMGLYTIGLAKRIGNRFVTHAFEPDPLYYHLFTKNVDINHVDHVVAHNVGLARMTKTIHAPGFRLKDGKGPKAMVSMKLQTLDTILTAKDIRPFDEIFIKIDIEGNEESAMDGAKKLWQSGKKIHLMIEDCVNPNIVQYLKKHGWKFITKITPYDSFWEMA